MKKKTFEIDWMEFYRKFTLIMIVAVSMAVAVPIVRILFVL